MAKDFNDFRAIFTEEFGKSIADKLNSMQLRINTPIISEDSVNKLMTTVTIISLYTAVEILEHYHNWLNSSSGDTRDTE